MQIVAKFVQIVALVAMGISCTKPSIKEQTSDSQLSSKGLLVTIADSIAELNPDSCLVIIPLITPPNQVATEEIKALALQIKGVAQITKGNTKEGLNNITASHSIFLNLNDSLALASSYRRMGYGFRKMNNYNEAIKCYVKALTILDEKHSTKDVAYLKNSLGLAFMYMKNYEKSIEYLVEA